MPKLTIIAAVAEDRAIGWKGSLLFHLGADMRRFRLLTTGHTVLMGRRTFESLPKGALPNRRNIVVSRREGAGFPGCDAYGSIEEALRHCADDEHVFVIGGASVYEAALPLASSLELTLVHARAEHADVYFPEINPAEWRETARESHAADEKNERPFDFVTFERA